MIGVATACDGPDNGAGARLVPDDRIGGRDEVSRCRGPLISQLRVLDGRALRDLLLGGHSIDRADLDGWIYRGLSLGLPGWVDRLAWKTFAKAFSGGRGWNVRIRQGGSGFEALRDRRGRPRCFGRFAVEPLPPVGDLPLPVERGLLLDYGRGGNGRLDPVRFLRDPVVALREGDADLLLGCSLLDVGLAQLTTPSFFLLERTERIDSLNWRP